MRDNLDKNYSLRDRGVSFNGQDAEELRNVLFAEISNRSADRRKFEAQIITNTALNRMREYNAKGTPKTLSEVLKAPNQYQGYGAKQYVKAKSGKLDKLSQEKLAVVDSVIEELKSGNFQDNSDGQVYYVHDKDGKIWLKTGKLFK